MNGGERLQLQLQSALTFRHPAQDLPGINQIAVIIFDEAAEFVLQSFRRSTFRQLDESSSAPGSPSRGESDKVFPSDSSLPKYFCAALSLKTMADFLANAEAASPCIKGNENILKKSWSAKCIVSRAALSSEVRTMAELCFKRVAN